MFKKHLWLLAVAALALFNLGQEEDSCTPKPFGIFPSEETIDPRSKDTNLVYSLKVYGDTGTLDMRHTCSACCSVTLNNTAITVRLVNEVPKGTQCVITVTDKVPPPAYSLSTSATITVLQLPVDGIINDIPKGISKPATPLTELTVGDVRGLTMGGGLQPYTGKIISGKSVQLLAYPRNYVFDVTAVSPGDSVVVVCDGGIPVDCVGYTFRVKAK